MAKIVIQNEEGQNLNRYKMTPVAGQETVFDLERMATITKQGTPYSEDTLGHYVQNEDVAALSTAVQSATLGGAAVPKSGTTLQLPSVCVRLPIMYSGTLISVINSAIAAGYFHGTFGIAGAVGVDSPANQTWGIVEYVRAASEYVHVIWRYDSMPLTYERIFIAANASWLTDWANISDGGHAASADSVIGSAPVKIQSSAPSDTTALWAW